MNAVIVVRRQVDRGKRAAFETVGPLLFGQQLGQRVVSPFGLQQPVSIDAAAFAHRAIDRARDGGHASGNRARVRLECTREELVKARVTIRIGLDRLGHVDCEPFEKRANQKILEPGRAHARGGEDQSRYSVLRQDILQPDEQAPAHARPATMRSKSACRASTVKGPVRIAASLPEGSSTKIAPEWSTV